MYITSFKCKYLNLLRSLCLLGCCKSFIKIKVFHVFVLDVLLPSSKFAYNEIVLYKQFPVVWKILQTHLNASIQFCSLTFPKRLSCVQWWLQARSYLSDNSISRAPNLGDRTPTTKTGIYKSRGLHKTFNKMEYQ